MSTTTARGPLLHRVQVLSTAEAEAVAGQVHALRREWRQRHETQPFFTLGTAAYLDAREGRFAEYQAMTRTSNAMLRAHFGDLLERFRVAVEQHVGTEAVYHPQLALPGFHIFLFDEAFRRRGASVHFDKQYEHIDWSSIGEPDTDRQLSLTLSVRLPAGGGGLLVWNINRIEIERMAPAERIEHSRANRVATFESYEVGWLAIHSGHQLHQIGAAPHLQPGDERITLQAHALPAGGTWVIYW